MLASKLGADCATMADVFHGFCGLGRESYQRKLPKTIVNVIANPAPAERLITASFFLVGFLGSSAVSCIPCLRLSSMATSTSLSEECSWTPVPQNNVLWPLLASSEQSRAFALSHLIPHWSPKESLQRYPVPVSVVRTVLGCLLQIAYLDANRNVPACLQR